MQLGRIALKLRAANTSLGNKIAGAAELDVAVRNTLNTDFAFVIPLAEDCAVNEYDPSINQKLTERFGVVVALQMDASQKDKTGIGAYDRLHDVRAELFKPLIGWDMGFSDSIYYRGGRLIAVNRGYLWYQFEFEYESRVVVDIDGYGEIEETTIDDRRPAGELPDFDSIYVDYILKPSVKWNDFVDTYPYPILPDDIKDPDMEQYIDLSEDLNAGAFTNAFASGFDFYKRSN